MAVIKCKMCGGDLNLIEGASTAECEYCGSVQTVPKVDDEKKLTLFARANRLRVACEFDKASGIYESIVADFPEEAEAYWGLVLCNYGIEYVDDPATGKKIPTCHRSSFDSIMDDSDFEQVMENADGTARRVYREEAKQIEEIRKGIIAVSSNEEPYDIFICYKETAEDGQRTLDSVLAQDIYDALTDKGYRVFFSRITLEDKLGVEYEPYIFAALNSAKIMLAFGTDYDYYNAVWVKNEWSRFLKLMAKDKEKHLIPCYKDIDAYDMPKEFAKLQAQDLGKVGATQDLLRGVEKLLPRKTQTVEVQPVTAPGSAAAPLLERAYMFLEDAEWENATSYFERVLDLEPKNALAYLGKFLAEVRLPRINALGTYQEVYIENANYKKARKYASIELNAELDEYLRLMHEQTMNAEYDKALAIYQHAHDEVSYQKALDALERLGSWKEAETLANECCLRIKEIVYQSAKNLLSSEKYEELEKAKNMLLSLGEWPGVEELAAKFDEKIEDIKLGKKYNEIIGETNKWTSVSQLASLETYQKAQTALERSISMLKSLNGWGDSEKRIEEYEECIVGLKERAAKKKMQTKDPEKIESAIEDFLSIRHRKDSEQLLQQCYILLEDVRLEKKYNEIISEANKWSSVSPLAPLETYQRAQTALERSISMLKSLNGWRDSEKRIEEYERYIVELKDVAENGDKVRLYKAAKEKMQTKNPKEIESAIEDFLSILPWKDSEQLLQQCYIFLENIKLEKKYNEAILEAATKGVISAPGSMENYLAAEQTLKKSIATLKTLNGWKDSEQRIKEYEQRIKEYEQRLATIVEQQAKQIRYNQQANWRSIKKCQHCGGEFKGLFNKVCMKCGKPKDY